MSKIITPEFEKLFEKYPLGSQKDSDEDSVVIARLYDESLKNIYFLTSYDSESGDCTGIALEFDRFQERKSRIWYTVALCRHNVKLLEKRGLKRDFHFQPVASSKLLNKQYLGFDNYFLITYAYLISLIYLYQDKKCYEYEEIEKRPNNSGNLERVLCIL